MKRYWLILVMLCLAVQAQAATILTIPGAWYGEARPNGAYAVSLLDGRVQTPDGVRGVPQPGEQVLYLRLAADGHRFAGQAHSGAGSWEWDGQQWQLRANPAFGISGLIYDSQDQLVFAVPGVTGTQGFRYVQDGTDHLVTGDETYADPTRRIWEYTTHGDITIGQGLAGCVALRETDASVNGMRVLDRRELRHGDCRFVRFNRDGDRLAVTMVDLPNQTTELLWFDASELDTFPAEADPTPVVIAPGPTFPVPVPTPAPTPTATLAPFELSTAHILGGSPDVRTWPVTTTITQVRFGNDGIEIDCTKCSPGNTSVIRPGDWPSGPDAGAGAFQYTLWLGMGIGGQSYAVGVIEFWVGRPSSGGGPLDPTGIPGNFTYFAPPMDVQPRAGDPVSFFLTQGDARRKDAHTVAERSNVVTVAWPSAAPAVFDFGGGAPAPTPTPQPTPSPSPSPDPQVAGLLAQIATLQAQLSTLQGTVDADAAQIIDLQAQIATLTARIVDLQNRPAPSCVAKVPSILKALGIKIGCSIQ